MSIRDLQVPFLPLEDIQLSVQDFCNRYNPSDALPIDIEFIIESDLGIEIIPIPGLRDGFGIDGFISNTFSSITIDQILLDKYLNRYRFTLAHEIAHMMLHKSVYQHIGFHSIEEWKSTINAFDPKIYSNMEYQANLFAGMLLIPDHHLKEHFRKSLCKLDEQGFDINENTELIMGYIATALSKIFEASPSAILVRIKQENLLKNL